MSDFHGRMMNIPVTISGSWGDGAYPDEIAAYNLGHRDARHAAAEIANEADIAATREAAAYAAGLEAAVQTADRLNGWGADCGRGGHARHIASVIRALPPQEMKNFPADAQEKPQEAPTSPDASWVADSPEIAAPGQHSGATAANIITRALDAFNARPCDAQGARLAAMFAAVDPVALAAALKAEGGR